MPFDNPHHLARPGGEGDRAGDIDFAADFQIGQAVGGANANRTTILGRYQEKIKVEETSSERAGYGAPFNAE